MSVFHKSWKMAATGLLLLLGVNGAWGGGVAPSDFDHDEFNGNPGENGTCNPIHIGSGNKFHEETIYRGGGEFPLEFNVYYNSQAHKEFSHHASNPNYSVVAGEWSYSYGQRLIQQGGNSEGTIVYLEMVRPSGQSHWFYRGTSDYQYNAMVGGKPDDGIPKYRGLLFGELRLLLDPATVTDSTVPVYHYISLEGFEEYYNRHGRLIQIRNLQGGGTHEITYSIPDNINGPITDDVNEMQIYHVERDQILTIQLRRTPDIHDKWQVYFWKDFPKGIITPGGQGLPIKSVQLPLYCVEYTDGECLRGYYENPITALYFLDNSVKTFDYTVQVKNPPSVRWYLETALTRIETRQSGVLEHVASYVYDLTNGRAIGSYHGDYDRSYSEEVTETSSGHVWTVKNRLGHTTNYSFSKSNGIPVMTNVTGGEMAIGNCVGSNSSYTYDSNGKLTNIYDNDTGLRTGYENHGVYEIDLGMAGLPHTITQHGVGNGVNRETSIEWGDLDSGFRLPTQITKPGISIDISYEHGRLRSRTEIDTKATLAGYTRQHSLNRRWDYLYTYYDNDSDGLHRVATLTVVEPRGGSTLYTYDTVGNLIGITNAVGHSITLSNHNEFSYPQTMLDANGVTTTMGYTPRGWLSSITTDGKNITFDYDALGHLTTITRADGSYLTYHYADGGRLYSISNGQGESLTITRTRNNGYEDFIFNTFAEGAQSLSRTVRFDALGRLWKMYDLSGVAQEYNYDANGNLTVAIDGNSGQIQRFFDAMGRLTSSVDQMLGNTQLDYDNQDNLVAVSAPNSATTTYDYDGFGNLLRVVSPDSGTTLYYYDDAGRLTAKADARDVTSSFSYDALGRLTSISYPDSNYDVRFDYDEGVNGVGHLTTMTDSSGTSRYQYDKHGNLTMVTTEQEGVSRVVSYSYDAVNRMESIIYPSGLLVHYRYNLAGRIDQVMAEFNGRSVLLADDVDYEPFGSLRVLRFGNGLMLDRNFNSDGRLLQSDTEGVKTVGYGYDAMGNITTMTELVGSGNDQHFDYDALSRLISENGSYGSRNYLYDANGNRTEREKIDNIVDINGAPATLTLTQSYSIEPGSNRLVGINNNSFVLDAVGNLLVRNKKAFAYGDNNRLISYTRDGVLKADYTYNGHGQRVKTLKHKSDSTTRTIRFSYNQSGQVIGRATYGKEGWRTNDVEYIWLDSRPIAQLKTRYKSDGTVKDAQLVYLHANHLDTPRLATDETGTVVWRWVSDAFGQGKAETDPDGDGIKTWVALRFPGQIQAEGGLYYNYFRDYDPSTGRYIQSDPIGLKGGLNTYGYALQNPLYWIDPLGLTVSCTYNQVTGQLTCSDDTTGQQSVNEQCYSGAPSVVNNPSQQNIRDMGPIPRGDYDIGTGVGDRGTGPQSLPLTPTVNNNQFPTTRDPNSFLMHGDNSQGNQSASKGCIICSRNTRNTINNAGGGSLVVQ